MFFDRLKLLCDQKGVSAYKACTDVGLNRAAVAKWKKGSQPNGTTALKLAEYFDVSVDYLLNKENAPDLSVKRIENKDIQLSRQELDLIHKFRQLDDRGKSAVLNALDHEYATLPGDKAAPAPKQA